MYRQKEIEQLKLKLNNGKLLIASDIHFPFQDDKAVEAFKRYAKKINPEVIVLAGDIIDCYKLSRFTKGEGRNPYEEIQECRKFLGELRRTVPQTDIYYIIGNHETRLENYVLSKAPELASLIEDIFSIIKVEDFNIKGCSELLINDNFVVTHGKLLGNKAGLSAIKEIEKHYMSGASGHCHKLAHFLTRKAGRKFEWYETGCLCDLNPEYVQDPDWIQGFVEITFNKNRRYGKIIEIEKGEILE